MKSLGEYLSRYIFTFFFYVLILLLGNILLFVLTFGQIVSNSYQKASPSTMLEKTALQLEKNTLSDGLKQDLKENDI